MKKIDSKNCLDMYFRDYFVRENMNPNRQKLTVWVYLKWAEQNKLEPVQIKAVVAQFPRLMKDDSALFVIVEQGFNDFIAGLWMQGMLSKDLAKELGPAYVNGLRMLYGDREILFDSIVGV